MSFEIVKSIKHSKKDNKYFVTSASNNVHPRYYSKWEYMPDSRCSDKEKENKDLHFFYSLISGTLQLTSSCNINWNYALDSFRNYCYENNTCFSDLYDNARTGEGLDYNYLKPYYEVFKSYYDEINEKGYYLDSNLGYITKINKRSFNYTNDEYTLKNNLRDYKKVKNIYDNLSKDMIEKYNIEIKQYDFKKEFDSIEISSKAIGL